MKVSKLIRILAEHLDEIGDQEVFLYRDGYRVVSNCWFDGESRVVVSEDLRDGTTASPT